MSRLQRVVPVIGVIACLAAAFLLTDPLIDLLHDITGGDHAADVVAGVLSVWVPLGLMFAILTVNGRRRGGRTRELWVLLLLLFPLDLVPFGRSGTNVGLEHRMDTSLPFLLQGLVLGAALLVVPVLILGWIAAHRRNRGSP